MIKVILFAVQDFNHLNHYFLEIFSREPQRSNPVGAIINRQLALIDMFASGLLRRKLLAMTDVYKN